jgi:hypothetical protein
MIVSSFSRGEKDLEFPMIERDRAASLDNLSPLVPTVISADVDLFIYFFSPFS